ncbi:hypothetical protein IU405_06045 [Polaribacter sp. BAL334]|uniref:hypothetical protein n=1 Tax=Polaribacter sp. BAL334 TaxID=1708178 RepID=UPI0018D24AED|nr:hypothetical protein [Polaribacter sp. BAL334]MBG7611803.1 hypothetical protein [Polaribacter sp. BAL334]
MATIKELKTEINNYLFPNIDEFRIGEEVEYQINGIWIDQLKDNYFFNESLLMVQTIEATILKSEKPILIITLIQELMDTRLIQLKNWKSISLPEYLVNYHRIAINENPINIEGKSLSKIKIITEESLLKTKAQDSLFKLLSFKNMVIGDGIHQNEDFVNIKLLYHINELIDNAEKIQKLMNEIIQAHTDYGLFRFEDYFKTFYSENVNKVQVDLKLKDLAYFFHFVSETKLFVMHPDKRKNKKMLTEFFEKNLMYTDGKGNPKHFKKFFKEISDVTTEDKKFQEKFVDDLRFKLEQFKSINLLNLSRDILQ